MGTLLRLLLLVHALYEYVRENRALARICCAVIWEIRYLY